MACGFRLKNSTEERGKWFPPGGKEELVGRWRNDHQTMSKAQPQSTDKSGSPPGPFRQVFWFSLLGALLLGGLGYLWKYVRGAWEALHTLHPALGATFLGLLAVAVLSGLALIVWQWKQRWRTRRPPLPAEQVTPERVRAEAVASLEHLRKQEYTEEERVLCAAELQALEELEAKVRQGELHLAFFGTISSGKSSVINCLLGKNRLPTGVIGGTTPTPLGTEWEVSLEGGGKIVLVDTPGLDEIGGEARERLAREAAVRADLVVLVVERDLTASEHEAALTLHQAGKPLLVAFNKIDNFTPETRREIHAALEERLAGLVPPQQIVEVNADPRPKVVLEVTPDGQEQEVEITPKPDVSALQAALLDAVREEGQALLIANAFTQWEQVQAQLAEKILTLREGKAQQVIENYVALSAVSVALNPFPVIDMVADAAVNAKMIADLAVVFGMSLGMDTVTKLGQDFAKALAAVGVFQAAPLAAGSLLKAVPGLGTVVGGALQGVVAGYTTYLIGRASLIYFRQHGTWGDRSLTEVMREVIAVARQSDILRSVLHILLSKFQERLTGPQRLSETEEEREQIALRSE